MTFNRETDFEFEVNYGKNADAGMKGIALRLQNKLAEAIDH